jgi:hypothetical protein
MQLKRLCSHNNASSGNWLRSQVLREAQNLRPFNANSAHACVRRQKKNLKKSKTITAMMFLIDPS